MSSATLPSVAKWVFLKSEPDTAPPHDSQCPWHSHSSSAWQLATAYFVGLAVTIPLLPCFATQNVGQLFEYTFLYLPFLSFAHNVLSPWLSLCNPFSSRPSLYILSVCKNQCKMKMWSTLLKNHEESHNGGSRSTKHRTLLKVGLCVCLHRPHCHEVGPALRKSWTPPSSTPRLLGAALSLNRPSSFHLCFPIPALASLGCPFVIYFLRWTGVL